MSSQSQSEFQAVAHLLLPCCRVTSQRFLANNELGCNGNSFFNCIFLPERGGTLAIFMCWTLKNIHALWANGWAVIMYFLHKYRCLIWALSSNGCNYPYTVIKVGGSLYQGPATEVTHLGLNQPPVLFQCRPLFVESWTFSKVYAVLPLYHYNTIQWPQRNFGSWTREATPPVKDASVGWGLRHFREGHFV